MIKRWKAWMPERDFVIKTLGLDRVLMSEISKAKQDLDNAKQLLTQGRYHEALEILSKLDVLSNKANELMYLENLVKEHYKRRYDVLRAELVAYLDMLLRTLKGWKGKASADARFNINRIILSLRADDLQDAYKYLTNMENIKSKALPADYYDKVSRIRDELDKLNTIAKIIEEPLRLSWENLHSKLR